MNEEKQKVFRVVCDILLLIALSLLIAGLLVSCQYANADVAYAASVESEPSEPSEPVNTDPVIPEPAETEPQSGGTITIKVPQLDDKYEKYFNTSSISVYDEMCVFEVTEVLNRNYNDPFKAGEVWLLTFTADNDEYLTNSTYSPISIGSNEVKVTNIYSTSWGLHKYDENNKTWANSIDYNSFYPMNIKILYSSFPIYGNGVDFVYTADTSLPHFEHHHNYVETTIIHPTCTLGGSSLMECSCGDSYTGNITPALGHDYQEEVVYKEDGETIDYTRIYCTRCNDETKKYPPHSTIANVADSVDDVSTGLWGVAGDAMAFITANPIVLISTILFVLFTAVGIVTNTTKGVGK